MHETTCLLFPIAQSRILLPGSTTKCGRTPCKRRTTNREKIAALESENKALKEQLDAMKLAKSETSLADAINKKIDEFQADFDKVATYSDKYYFSGNGAWVDEALTVYKNVIDVLKGLKA